MKLVSWKATPRRAKLSVRVGRSAQQGRHDPAHGRCAPVHVALQLLPRLHPHGPAVDAHRVHVGPQLAERQVVASAGVGQRGDHGVGRVARLDPVEQLRSPAGRAPDAARGWVRGAPRPVDQLVGAADERVDGVHRRPHVGGEPARGEVVGGVVAAVHPAAGGVRGPQVGGHASGTESGRDRVMVPEGAATARGRSRRRPRRNRAVCETASLHDALRDFALESAKHAARRAGGGRRAGVRPRRGQRRAGPTLYHYRPLTGRFIAERWDAAARRCRSCAAGGRAAGLRRGRLPADERPARRGGRARAARDARAPVRGRHGLHLPRGALRARLRRGRAHAVRGEPVGRGARARHGLVLEGWSGSSWPTACASCRGEATDAPDEAVWGEADGGIANTLLMLTRDVAPDDPLPLRGGARGLPATAHRPAPVEARRRSRSARWHGGAPATGAGSRSSSSPPARPAASRGSSCRGRGGRAGRVPRGDRPPGTGRRRGVGAGALRDGVRPGPRGGGPVRLPAGAARARSTTGARAWRCGWRCSARRTPSASGCSGGWSWRRRWSDS